VISCSDASLSNPLTAAALWGGFMLQ